jgi:serine/threonine protein kinase/tetratricopeptide (TPR) repeat protein
MTLTSGARFGVYEIVAPLGAGGMGEVYRAHDPRLDRDVAVKVLPAEFVADPERLKRFEREARATAALSHPNILAVHDVGTHEGVPYLVEELLEGESLKERLDRGALSTGEALRIAGEIARGLAAAHEKGIVHRDLKPGNVFLTRDGTVKVLDFGLAKLVPTVTADEAETLTAAATATTRLGGVLGTAAYMAPEQARGRLVDQRADVFAFGVVLYEMLSGERPFKGASGTEVLAAILADDPAPLPAAVPQAVAMVVARCLEKDPARRYQRGSELRAALEAVQSGATIPVPSWLSVRSHRRWLLAAAVTVAASVSVLVLDVGGLRSQLVGRAGGPVQPIKLAVLPFANLTGDPDQEYLSDGFTQELIAQLARLRPTRMSVIGRTSVMRYKKSDAPIEQIGRELGAGYILGGSCRRESAQVRISVELIQVRDQAQLWTETYESELSGVLVLQSEVARKVAGALALELLPADEARLAQARSLDPEAYEAYLKGVRSRDSLTRAGFDEAEHYFNLATEKDPGYAAPWAGLAGLWNSRLQLNMAPREEALIKAKSAALKALALDDGEVEARRVLAGILTWADWDWAAAERAWDRLFEIDPDNTMALPGYSHFLLVTGRLDEAIAKSERALELDPYSIRTQSFHATVLMHARRFDEAIAVARRALSIQSSEVARTALRDSFFMKGMHAEFMTMEKERWANDPELTKVMEQGYDENGVRGAEKNLADALAARYGRPGGVTAYTLANHYARAGDGERVIEWLEKAYLEHNNNLPYLGTPVFDLVRADPRLQSLRRRMNLPATGADDQRQPARAAM